MSGLPAIVAGVFIYSILVETSWPGFSGFLAALALFVLMLPSVTRTTEEVLRIVPGGCARHRWPSARRSGAPCGRWCSRRPVRA